jgi:hypothetical protein
MIYLLKVIALGSSRAIVLPLPLLSALDIDCGDILAVQSDKSGAFHIERATADLLKPGGMLSNAEARLAADGNPNMQKLNATLKSLEARHPLSKDRADPRYICRPTTVPMRYYVKCHLTDDR